MALKKLRKDNYPEWYQCVVSQANMAENSSSPGCMVIKPWGYGIWERIQRLLDEKIKDKSSVTFDYVKEWSESTSNVTLTIKSNQFLSHIKDDIIANLSHITLLEAGAGYGKTEMIKSLKAKIDLIFLLIMISSAIPRVSSKR